jgi:hypothetical protein
MLKDAAALADEAAIRRLGAAYADACSRLCPADVACLFAPNATMGMAGGKVAPGNKILKNFEIVLGRQEFLLQTLHSGLIELCGDTARGRWWMSEILRARGEDRYKVNHGFYEDTYVRTAAGWLIQSRLFTLRLTTPLPAEACAGAAPVFALGSLT